MKIYLFKRKDESIINDIDNNLTYEVEIGKGMIGIVLEIDNDNYFICDIIREELKEIININDQLLKINGKNVNKMSLKNLVKFCQNLKYKNKKIEIMKSL